MASSEEYEGRQLLHATAEDGKSKKKTLPLAHLVNCAVLLVSVVSFAVSAGCSQALGGIIPIFELNVWLYLANFLMVTPPVFKQHILVPEKKHIPWMVVVYLGGWVFNITIYTAPTHLPLGTLAAADSGLTVIFTCLVTLVVFRECTKSLSIAVVVCIVGLVLLTQPEFIFPATAGSAYNPVCKCADLSNHSLYGDQDHPLYHNASGPQLNASDTGHLIRSTVETSDITGYTLVTAAAASATLVSFVTNKKLGDINAFTLLFWESGLGVVTSAVIMVAVETPTLPGTMVCAFLMVGHAVATAIENTTAVMSEIVFHPAIVCLPYLMNGVLTLVAQYTFMKAINPGKQNFMEIVGAVLVIVGNAIIPSVELYELYVYGARDADLVED